MSRPAVRATETSIRTLLANRPYRFYLVSRVSLIIAAQPTRGLDVGAIEYMTERLHDAANSGIAVLLISTELEEILTTELAAMTTPIA